MRNRIPVASAILASLLTLPIYAWAADSDKIDETLAGKMTLGGAAVAMDRKSFKFGEYSGITEGGGYAVGNADVNYNKGSYFLNFNAEDLGLENRKLFLDSGIFGNYKLHMDYEELPHYISNQSQTPFKNAGGTTLTLPPSFVRGATTAGMTITPLENSDQSIKRRGGNLGYAKSFGENNDFNLNYHKEDKQGIMSIGGVFGTGGGNARGAVLPEPVNQTVDEISASFAHNGEDSQVRLDYFYSAFNNKAETLTWSNPYTGTDFPTTGLIGRSPDNQYWKTGLSGGVNLPHSSRISAIAEYGVMRQNENLLPYSLGTSASLLPRSAADAEIDTIHFTLNASSNPLPKLNLAAKYRHYQTQNQTPKDLFLYIKNDGPTSQQATRTSDFALYSLPYDYTQDQLTLDAAYGIFQATTLKLGYGFEYMNRNYREVKQTAENTAKVGLTSNYFSKTNLGFRFAFSNRNPQNGYDEFQVVDARHTKDYIDAQVASGVSRNTLFDNNPLARRFDIAQRDRKLYTATANFFPTDNATVSVIYNRRNDDYGASQMGLTSSNSHNATLNLTYMLSEATSLHAFYTYENSDSDQSSRSFNSTAGTSDDATRNWSANHDDKNNTVGAGFQTTFLQKQATLSADYSYSQSNTDITFASGGNSAVANLQNLPALKTTLHNINIVGKYRLVKNVDVGLRYLFERYESDNFLTDKFDPGTKAIANELTLGDSIPNYNAHLGMLFVTYHFDGK